MKFIFDSEDLRNFVIYEYNSTFGMRKGDFLKLPVSKHPVSFISIFKTDVTIASGLNLLAAISLVSCTGIRICGCLQVT